jgi:hypothetical protein
VTQAAKVVKHAQALAAYKVNCEAFLKDETLKKTFSERFYNGSSYAPKCQ